MTVVYGLAMVFFGGVTAVVAFFWPHIFPSKREAHWVFWPALVATGVCMSLMVAS